MRWVQELDRVPPLVAGPGPGEAQHPGRALGDLQGQGQLPLGIGPGPGGEPRPGEDPTGEQVPPRRLQAGRAVGLPYPEPQTAADIVLPQAFEPADGDGPQCEPGTGLGQIDHIHGACIVVHQGIRGRDLGEGEAGLAQGLEHRLPGGQDRGGVCRRPRFQVEGGPRLWLYLAVQADQGEAVEGPRRDGRLDRHRRAGRQVLEQREQGGVVQGQASDADVDGGVVVAEGAQHGIEASAVRLGPADEG